MVFSFHFASCSIKQFCEYGGSSVRLVTKDNHPAQRWKICGYTDCEECRLTACCCRLIFGSLKTDNFSLGLQVNTHITPRPILLTRHGESQDNIRGRIGGDPPLSEQGEKYALRLADFVHKRLKTEAAASVSCLSLSLSCLQ
jgi:hypothetical protein